MARKKIIYVIVEGPSDDEALGVIFQRLFTDQEILSKSHMETLLQIAVRMLPIS